MPSKIIDFDDARKRPRGGETDLYGLLTRLDELEDALETLDEVGVTTREELASLIERLEAEAERLDSGPKGE
jgi:hypothetical protein